MEGSATKQADERSEAPYSFAVNVYSSKSRRWALEITTGSMGGFGVALQRHHEDKEHFFSDDSLLAAQTSGDVEEVHPVASLGESSLKSQARTRERGTQVAPPEQADKGTQCSDKLRWDGLQTRPCLGTQTRPGTLCWERWEIAAKKALLG